LFLILPPNFQQRASGPDAGVLLVGTTNGSIIAVGIFSSSEVSVALRTSAAAVLVRGHMGDVNALTCHGDKQVCASARAQPCEFVNRVNRHSFSLCNTGGLHRLLRQIGRAHV
jgi:hypothetical protein